MAKDVDKALHQIIETNGGLRRTPPQSTYRNSKVKNAINGTFIERCTQQKASL
jgi:hypothetical protein